MREYWKKQLDTVEKGCYETILAGLRKRTEHIGCGDAPQRAALRAYAAVYKDHPELFYANSCSRTTQKVMHGGFFTTSRVSTSLTTTNIYDNRTIDRCVREIQEICNGIRPKENDFHSIVQCVEYLVLHTEYKIDHHLNQNAAAALCFREAQCSGIARALKLLLDHLNIGCIVVDGHAFDENHTPQPHSWNIVQVNGRCYHVDATFMLGANLQKRLPLYRRYLFGDDNRMRQTHQWDHRQVPSCEDPRPYAMFNTGEKPPQTAACETLPTYRSLYELKEAIRRSLGDREVQMRFVMDIPSTSADQLMRLLETSCRMVLDSYPTTISYSIQMAGNGEITLTIGKEET